MTAAGNDVAGRLMDQTNGEERMLALFHLGLQQLKLIVGDFRAHGLSIPRVASTNKPAEKARLL